MTKEMKTLTKEIVEEHHRITEVGDSNLNYLWWMYHDGTKKGDWKPFIYMAELQLVKRFDYINDSEIQNLVSMMESKDEDNMNIVTLAIMSLRQLRITEHGIYDKAKQEYLQIAETYPSEILNHEVFTQTMKAR
jgi:succinate dehydrogenase flavin-adding protein (antitoxin of CptAB toxin-antitoxin module)